MIGNPLKFSEHADSTTFCCEIQPAWLRSNKNRTLPNTSIQGPTKSLLPSCQRTSGKMCRHNLTGYISPRMEANTDFFYLVGLEYYLLKYNGCQLATAEKWGLHPTLQQRVNIAPIIINYKQRMVIIRAFSELWAQKFCQNFSFYGLLGKIQHRQDNKKICKHIKLTGLYWQKVPRKCTFCYGTVAWTALKLRTVCKLKYPFCD